MGIYDNKNFSQKEVKIFAYLRVRKNDVNFESNLKKQENDIISYTQNRPEIKIVEFFRETIEESFKERPIFNEMINRMKEVDGIIVSNIDRIGKSVKDLIEIIQSLKDNGKILYVIDCGIFNRTINQDALLEYFKVFREYQKRIFTESSFAGYRSYLENGGKLGRTKKELIDISDNKPVKDKDLIKMYEKNQMSLQQIANYVGVKSKNTIKKRLIDLGIKIRPKRGN